MAQKLSNIKILRQFETPVRVFPEVGRFITIVGLIPEVRVPGGETHAETYTCLVGPVLKADEFIGASCLPSIARLESSTLEPAQSVIESSEADWAKDSEHVELRVQLFSAGGAASVQILFSVTILANAG
jgi:hypothetical protein